MIGKPIPSGASPEYITRFVALKSGLTLRSDGKGYATSSNSFTEVPTTADWNKVNASKCVDLDIYGYMPGLGVWLLYSVILYPSDNKKDWFQSTVNQIYPTRWIQTMSAVDSTYGKIPFGILSTDIYDNVSSSSETVLKFEYYKLF